MARRPTIVVTPRRAKQEAIVTAIENTRDRTGRLSADGVVEAAKDPNNPLHDQFEWDDTIAAHQHRLAVARALIREIHYIGYDSNGEPKRTVAYVAEPGVTGRSSYIPLSAAAKNKALAREIVVAELTRCQGHIKRAQDVADVLGLRAALDKVLHDIIDLQNSADLSLAKKKPPKGRGRKDDDDDRPHA